MKRLLVSLLFLIPISLSASSVTYTTANFTVTAPDFLENLQPGAVRYVFQASELSRCGSPGENCISAGFESFYDGIYGTVVNSYIKVALPDGSLFTEPSGYFKDISMRSPGFYRSFYGPGTLRIELNEDQVTYAPEPVSTGLIASVLIGLFFVRRRKHA